MDNCPQVFTVVNLTLETEVLVGDVNDTDFLQELKKEVMNGDRIFIINSHHRDNLRPLIDDKGEMHLISYKPKLSWRGFDRY